MSRELDAKVAEALGCTVAWKQRPDMEPVAFCTCGRHGTPILRRYSTDITAAIPLFGWLAGRGLVRLCNGDGDSKDCDFTPDGFPYPDLRRAHISADTWAGAISLAFVVANGID